tara:strand:+ start:10680 stop:11474 length:795 start_codon:yes stop_codon:yes gene_type:complete
MIKYLILGPGALGYFSLLGHLKKLHNKHLLHELKEISGSSAGSILGFLYIVYKGNIDEILKTSLAIDLQALTKAQLSSLLIKYGFVDISTVKVILSNICKRRMGEGDPTFEQLFEHMNVNLYISAYCVTDNKTEYFSLGTHPSLSVIDAVCASIAIPILFSTSSINNKIYIDGGTHEKMPSVPFLGHKLEDIYSIEITRTLTNDEKIKDFKSYIMNLMNSTMVNRITCETIPSTKTLDMQNFDILNFKLNDFEKLRLFVFGYTA